MVTSSACKRRGRSARLAALACASALPLLGGCATGGRIYLHNPQLEAQTAQIKTDFAALKAPAYLEAQRTRAAEFAAREDAAVAALSTSSRNAALVGFIRPNPLADQSADSAAKLKTRVAEDLATLYRPAPWKADELDRLADASRAIDVVDVAAVAAASNAEAIRQRIQNSADNTPVGKATKAAPRACPDVKAPPDPLPLGLSSIEGDYLALQIACAEIRRYGPDGELRLRATGAVEAASANSDLAKARKAYQAALANRAAAQKVGAELAAKIKELIEKNAAEKKPAGFDQDVAAALAKLEKAEPLVRALGLQALADTLEPELAQAIKSDAKPPATASAETKRIAGSLKFLSALQQLAADYESKPDLDRGDALLIAIAELRHQQSMAALTVAWEERRMRLQEAQVKALLLQAEQLVRAYKLLDAPGASPARGFADLRGLPKQVDKARLAEGLTAYAASWDVGQTPYWVLKFKDVQFRRMEALERAQQTEADTRAVLAPSINALAAGGAGGVKPETWATLLGDLSIAGAIVGK